MIRSFLSAVIVLLCFALFESAILSNILILPAVPDLLLIVVLYLSMRNGKGFGEASGAVSGVFLDFLSSSPFGLNCLIRVIIGYCTGFFSRTLNANGFFILHISFFLLSSLLVLRAYQLQLLLLRLGHVLYSFRTLFY